MTDNGLVGGKANIAKYMELLDREKDLKSKLQQMFLKKQKDEAELNAEITRLNTLLEQKENEQQSSTPDLSNELDDLQEKFSVTNRKLNNCRTAYLDLEAKSKEQDSSLKEKDAEITSLMKKIDELKAKPAATAKPAKKKVSPEKKASEVKAVSLKSSPVKDDLTLIKGVGPKLKDVLYKQGITSFDQIAAWKEADIKEVDNSLKFKGRIKRDKWVQQAKKLSKAK